MKVILDRLEAISKILLILGTLAGGFWAIREYFDKQHDARVAETLGYVRRFSSDPLQAAQTHIGMAWYSVKDVLRTLEETPVASPEEFVNRKRQLVMTVVDKSIVLLSPSTSQKGLVPDLDLLVGFFAELQVCLDAQLCDRPVAKKYFQPYAQRLYCVHEPFIAWKTKSYSQGYGNELKKMAFPTGGQC